MIRHLTSVDDFLDNDCNEIFRLASKFEKGGDFRNLCNGKFLEIAFFKPSIRTMNSLEAAISNLGGSLKKLDPQVFNDSRYDIETALRSLVPGSHIMAVRYENQDLDLTTLASRFPIPLINAMAGKEHAVGGFWFYYSLSKRFDLSKIKIGVYGLAGESQPLRAIIKLLGRFGATFFEDSVIDEFKTSEKIIKSIQESGGNLIRSHLNEFLGKIDVLIICEGGQTESLDRDLMKKYLKIFRTITMKEISKIKEDSLVITITPRRLEDDRDTVDKEVIKDKRFFDDILMNETVFVHMAVIHYLLNCV